MWDYENRTIENIQSGYINSSRSLYLWTLFYISGLTGDQLTTENVSKILHFMHETNARYVGKRWKE